MMDTEETLAALRAQLIREPVHDHSEETIARLQAANEHLHHRLKVREFENSSLYRRIGELEKELLAEREKGDRHLDGNSFASLEQSADAIK